MEFLLILSAVLSAVTGAFSGARAPEARPQHAASAQVVAIAQPCATAEAPAARIEKAPAALAPRVPVPEMRRIVLAAAIPLYADRLIE